MTEEEMRQQIIGCAFKVHRKLGAGFVEKVYENALRIKLEHAQIPVQQQAPIQVFYDGEVVGEFFADLLIANRLIVELKAVQTILKEHEIQLFNYLSATNIDTGLLINFGKSVEVRRKFRDYQPSTPVNLEKSR